jgi:lipoate-protein ligase A
MLLKDVSFPSPEENILYDEVLLQLAEQGKAKEVLRFWESPRMFIVLGRIGKEEEDIKMDAVRTDHVPVLRRASGGGTVLQGPGCLNYTLILSKEHDSQMTDLRKSYENILGKVILALKRLGTETMFCPISDIALANGHKKISGNAQKRARKYFLHHGTILYKFDLSKIERYLRIPKDIPEYRRDRIHLDFVANVPVASKAIKEALKVVFDVDRQENDLTQDEKEYLQSLLRTRNLCVELPG